MIHCYMCILLDDDSFGAASVMSISGRRKWTPEETEEFNDAVHLIGVGKWAIIKEYLGTWRTSVMLKDKWRNMITSGEAGDLKKKTRKT